MHLSPKEVDKLLLHQAGFLAQKRYARGLLLNYPETVALIASQLLEFIREGDSVASLMNKGKQILGLTDVMPGVAGMVDEVQVEGTFPDGTKLVTIHSPICNEIGNPLFALYGSGLTYQVQKIKIDNAISENPGKMWVESGDIEINAGRDLISIPVTNMGDRPIQVGSHYPFFETNPFLQFDREKAFGHRLNIPSGTAVRFEPGDTKTVELVKIAGNQIVFGGSGLTSGSIDFENKMKALQKAQKQNFFHQPINQA